jgi:cystathionine beta-lyase family protein involved in aluminum resistance
MIENNEIYNQIMESINHYRQARERVILFIKNPDEEYRERVKQQNINLDFAAGSESQAKTDLVVLQRTYSEFEARLWELLVKIAECKKI